MSSQRLVFAGLLLSLITTATAAEPDEPDQGGIGGTGNTTTAGPRPEGVSRPDMPERIEIIDIVRPEAAPDIVPTLPDAAAEPPPRPAAPQR